MALLSVTIGERGVVMSKRHHAGDPSGRKSPRVAGLAEDHDGKAGCRCKEMAKKTPAELLKTVISDLSFWKKKK